MTTAQIQDALRTAGFDPGPTDGKNGPKTQAAVRAYQQANGLAVDGIAGSQTQAKLQGTSTAAPGAAATPQGTFQDRYPQFAWAFNDPEVNKILTDAVANKWGPDEVQGAIQNTNWWKSKSDAERNWLQTLAIDPREATKRLYDYDSITKYMSQAASYGLPVSFDAAQQQVARVVRGEVDPTELTEQLRIQAKALYPQLSQQIDAGSTVADIYAPYQSAVVNLLGVNPASVNLSDPKWTTPLQYRAKDGQIRLATRDEWETQLRTDPRFGFDSTTNGRQEAAQFATQVATEFGVMG